MLFSNFKKPVQAQTTKTLCLLLSPNGGVTSFSSVCYSVLTPQISAACSVEEWRHTLNIKRRSSYLLRGFGSDSAPSQASLVRARSFATGTLSAQRSSLCENIKCSLWIDWESGGCAATYSFDYSSSCPLFVCSGLFRGEPFPVWGRWVPQRATTDR